MENPTLDDILVELEKLKEKKPLISYQDFWKEVDRQIVEENTAFAREDERLRIKDWRILHRPFTI